MSSFEELNLHLSRNLWQFCVSLVIKDLASAASAASLEFLMPNLYIEARYLRATGMKMMVLLYKTYAVAVFKNRLNGLGRHPVYCNRCITTYSRILVIVESSTSITCCKIPSLFGFERRCCDVMC